MTTEPQHVDPNAKKPAGGERNQPGYVPEPKPTSSGSTSPSTAPTPTKPCDDAGCGTPKAAHAGSSQAAGTSPATPQPGPSNPPPAPGNDSHKRPPQPGVPSPRPLPPQQPPGRPKGQMTGQQPVSTAPRQGQPAQTGRADRPGENVRTDRSGKTYEGETGVSGETAGDDL